MTSDRARRLRHRSLLAVGSVLAALVLAGVAVGGAHVAGGHAAGGQAAGGRATAGQPTGGDPASDAAGGDGQITVMTQNMYVGTNLNAVFGASSWADFTAAGTSAWANLLATDFPTRAVALADEIAAARPDVVGLQEVSLWRDQTPGDLLTHAAPNATHVAFDFLAILGTELSARGIPYTPVATSTNADLEFPRLDPAGGLVDVRVTDRDALLVRTDRMARTGNAGTGHYAAQFSDPFPTGPVTSTRSWTSIDYRVAPATTVRIFNTHLEVGDPVTGMPQEQQGNELAALIAASPHPVIALGDFNSPADGSTTRTYRNLTAVLHDAWTSARPADPGWTCCQAPSLADAVGREAVRIDLVLTSGDWPVTRVERTGDLPFRAAPPPLWVSDHLGLTAQIVIPP